MHVRRVQVVGRAIARGLHFAHPAFYLVEHLVHDMDEANDSTNPHAPVPGDHTGSLSTHRHHDDEEWFIFATVGAHLAVGQQPHPATASRKRRHGSDAKAARQCLAGEYRSDWLPQRTAVAATLPGNQN